MKGRKISLLVYEEEGKIGCYICKKIVDKGIVTDLHIAGSNFLVCEGCKGKYEKELILMGLE